MRLRALAILAIFPAAFLLRCVEDGPQSPHGLPHPTFALPRAEATTMPPSPLTWTCGESTRLATQQRLRALPADVLAGSAGIEALRKHVGEPFHEVTLKAQNGAPQAVHLHGRGKITGRVTCPPMDLWKDEPPVTEVTFPSQADLAPLFAALKSGELRRWQSTDGMVWQDGASDIRVHFAGGTKLDLARKPTVGWIVHVDGCGDLISSIPNLMTLLSGAVREKSDIMINSVRERP